MDATDDVFLVFAYITLYFAVLFMFLHYRNRKDLFLTPETKSLPRVTIIVPAYNEEGNIAGTIRNVKAFDYPKELLEIIVVDDGSTDRTSENAKNEGVLVFTKRNGGKGAAINYGIEHASGTIVGVVDADSYPDAGGLKAMVPYFDEAGVAAVTSSVLVKDPRNYLERLQEMEYLLIAWGRKLLDYLGSVYVTPGPLSLYRKDALEKIGGFDEKILTEDIEVAWRLHRAGYQIKMALGARVYTKAPRTFKRWWNQRLRWDIGGLQTVAKHGGTLFDRRHGIFGLFIVPFFSISILLSLVGLGLFAYLFLSRAVEYVVFAYYAWQAGINPLDYYSVSFIPNVFTVLGILGFGFSFVYLVVGLRTMGKHIGPGTLVDMFLYLVPYLFLFPILLIHSFWRLAVYRKQRW